MQDHDYSLQRTPMFKLVLIGESGVGKTSLFMRIKEGVFSSDVTVGIESCSTAVEVDGTRVKFVLWDTAGVERFRTLTRNYYRNAQCVLLTCSRDDKTSLDSLHRWNQDVDFYCKDCLKVIVASKNDLNPAITEEQLQNFAATFGCKLISAVSAKTGDGVAEMLREVARKLLKYFLAGHSGATRGSLAGGSMQAPRNGTVSLRSRRRDSDSESGCGRRRRCCSLL